MKIRSDFVTNSSSSSFVVNVCVKDKKGRKFSFRESEFEHGGSYDGGTASFDADLREVLKSYIDSQIDDCKDEEYDLYCYGKEIVDRVENTHIGATVSLEIDHDNDDYYGDVINFNTKDGTIGLLSGMDEIERIIKSDRYEVSGVVTQVVPLSKQDNKSGEPTVKVKLSINKNKNLKEDDSLIAFNSVESLCRFLTESVAYEQEKYVTESKTSFIKKASEKIESVDDIQSIEVIREYDAWGEFADLIAENDRELCECARRVISTAGAEHDNVIEEMLEIIHTPNGNRGDNFGYGIEDFRYKFEDTKEAVEELAKRLCSNHCAPTTSGVEYRKLDVTTGEYEEYAEFDLC